MASSYHQLGNIAFRRGEYDQALDWYRQALTIKEELGNRASMATSYGQLGMVAEARGDYDQALDWYHQALTIFEELGNRARMAASYGQMGALLSETGRAGEGLIWTLRSLRLHTDLRTPHVSTDLWWLERQRALLGSQQFERLLNQELGEDSRAVLVLLGEPAAE